MGATGVSVLAHMEAVAKQQDAAREAVQKPIVDSWACFKAFVSAFEDHCGELTAYAARHTLYAPHRSICAQTNQLES